MKVQQQPASRRQSLFAWAICALIILMGLASVFLFALNRNTVVGASWSTPGGMRNNPVQWLNILLLGFVTPTVAAVLGALIVGRQAKHRIGWLLLLLGGVSGLLSMVNEYAVYGSITSAEPLPGTEITAWMANWLWVALYAILMLTLALFPGGHFLSRGWMVAVGLTWLLFSAPLLLAAAIEQPMSSVYSLPNPFVAEHPEALYDTLFMVGVPMMPLMVIVVLAQVVARYRGSGPVERQQIKWLVAGVAGLVAMVVIGLVLVLGLGSSIGAIMVNTSVTLPMLAIGVAVLRYRLYDIDLIIRRTLVYALSTGVLLLVYFGSVTLLTSLFSSFIGQQSALAIVISTLVIAALFNPLRRRLQQTIYRRFYRRKYDAQQVLARFAQTARDETDLDALTAELVRVVQETLQPEQVSIWLRQYDGSDANI